METNVACADCKAGCDLRCVRGRAKFFPILNRGIAMGEVSFGENEKKTLTLLILNRVILNILQDLKILRK